MADRFDLINFGKSVVTTTGGTTANVNIDANTLFIDGTNNRVGVGTNAPTAALQVAGDIVSSGTIVPGSSYLRNRIINGNFDVWQRGTSGFSTAAGTYTADRWRNDQIITVARSTDVPAGSLYSFDVTQTSPSFGTFVQRIESINCYDLAGQQVTVSFWARSISGSAFLNVLLRRANAVDDFSGTTNIQNITVSTPPSTSWTRYTATFNVLPSQAANGLELALYRDTGTAQTRYAQVQLEVGSVATPFERRQFGQELELCQRYYESLRAGGGMQWASGGDTGVASFKVTKRATPTVSISTVYYDFPTGSTWSASDITVDGFRIVRVGNTNFLFIDARWIASIEL